VAYTLSINGKAVAVDAPGDTPLLWALRDTLGMVGTKYGCGISSCGACTVHLDGLPVRACQQPIAGLAGKAIVTIEGIGADPVGRQVQAAWVELDVAQCGYCQPGQILAATALLKTTPHPSDAQIDAAMSRNLCRCATYLRIRAAIKTVGGVSTATAQMTEQHDG